VSDDNPGRRRRRNIVGLTAVAGGALLGKSLSSKPDSREFYLLTGAVAAVWTLGGLAAAPQHREWTRMRVAGAADIMRPVAMGAGAFAAFYAAARVARRVPALDRALRSVLTYSHEGSDAAVLGTALVNGVAEEIFFRGAVYDAAGPRHQAAATTATYMAVTAATRNPALVAASGVMGWIFAKQRRESGGIIDPIITHVTWSTLMLRYVPPLFEEATQPADGSGHSQRDDRDVVADQPILEVHDRLE
jgi:membrane protease YdiL (CAAX protease family)